MTTNEQIKILYDKIKAYKAQYDLDRQAAKISSLSSCELEKHEYLTGENLGYKPDVVQKAKSEYSTLGQVFNKGLDTSERTEGLLKRLKNIEGKNEQQLEAIRDQGEKRLDLIGKVNTDQTKRIGFYDKENKQAVELSFLYLSLLFKLLVLIFIIKLYARHNIFKINKVIRENKNKSLVCTHSNGTQYDFNRYRDVNQFGNDLYNGELSIDDARNEQYEMQILINKLERYDARNKRKKLKMKLLLMQKNFII